jgi:hypothetical protein
MKKSAIRDIFNGKRGDCGTMYDGSREARELADKLSDAYDLLVKKLSPETMEYHKKYLDALESSHIEEVDFYFVEGFKLGLSVGIEATEERE